MTYRIELTEAASAQLREAAAWWRTNRPGVPDLLVDELQRALAVLEDFAPLTRVIAVLETKEVRKIRLPRTRMALYYTIDGDLVTIHALWHGARGSGPPLP